MPTALRFAVLERDGFRCQYCGAAGDDAKLHVDHVHPKSKGGTNRLDNLVTACERCNLGKSDRVLQRTPATEPTAPSTVTPPDALVGRYVHTFDGPDVRWQGRIVDATAETVCLQLYSWISGDPTEQRVVPRSEMTGWRLYATRDAWCAEGDRLGAAAALRAYHRRYRLDAPDGPRWTAA